MDQLLAVISIVTLCSCDVFNDENKCMAISLWNHKYIRPNLVVYTFLDIRSTCSRKKETLTPSHGVRCMCTLTIERFSEVLHGTNCNSFVNNVCTEPDLRTWLSFSLLIVLSIPTWPSWKDNHFWCFFHVD